MQAQLPVSAEPLVLGPSKQQWNVSSAAAAEYAPDADAFCLLLMLCVAQACLHCVSQEGVAFCRVLVLRLCSSTATTVGSAARVVLSSDAASAAWSSTALQTVKRRIGRPSV